MKKCIFIITLILFSNYLFSQSTSFSIVLDPQIAWLRTEMDEVKNDGVIFGFNGGLVLDRYFTENYAFSTGISLWQTGGKLLFTEETVIEFIDGADTLEPNTSMTYRLQYLTIPISLKLNSNQIGYILFFAHLGLNNHINVGERGTVESLDLTRVGLSDEIKFYSMSYFFGGGGEYSLGGNTSLFAGIYFTSGFLDITTSEDYRANLNALSLRLGIRF